MALLYGISYLLGLYAHILNRPVVLNAYMRLLSINCHYLESIYIKQSHQAFLKTIVHEEAKYKNLPTNISYKKALRPYQIVIKT